MLTLATARPILWSYVSPVPFSTATDDQIAQFDATLNRLCERLILEGKWRGTFKRVLLATHGDLLTLPRNLQSCLGVDPVSSTTNPSGFPLNIYSRWFEFAASGPGLSSSACSSCLIRGLVPISDDAQTFADPAGTFYLRAKSTRPSGTGFTFAGGTDENSVQLNTNVRLAVSDGTTTTTQKYTEMPFIEKAITNAAVSLYSVDTTTAVETLLCVYAPSETIPAYRRYAIPNAKDGDTFLCLCKLAFVPAIVDSDPIIPSVTDALILGLMSFQFRDKNDPERSAMYMGPNYPEESGLKGAPTVMAGAIDVLETDRDELDSGERLTLNIGHDFGAGNIFNVR